MSVSEIVSLIATICAMISAIAAVISCILHYRFTRPKIKIEIESTPQKCTFCHFQKPTGEIESAAYLQVRIHNTSAVAGTIGGLELIVNKMSISAETIGSNYEPPKWLNVNLEGGYLKQDSEFYRLKVPRVVPAYSAIVGYFLFPKFPPGSEEGRVSATIEYKLVDKKIKVKQIKNVTFFDMWKFRKHKLSYEGYIKDYDYFSTSNINIKMGDRAVHPLIYTYKTQDDDKKDTD